MQEYKAVKLDGGKTRNEQKSKFMTVPVKKGMHEVKGVIDKTVKRKVRNEVHKEMKTKDMYKKEPKRTTRLEAKASSQKNLKQVKDTKKQDATKIKPQSRQTHKGHKEEKKTVVIQTKNSPTIEESKVCTETKENNMQMSNETHKEEAAVENTKTEMQNELKEGEKEIEGNKDDKECAKSESSTKGNVSEEIDAIRH